MTRPNAPTCDDCYFRRNGLCAMAPERPCPTFRAAARTLQRSPESRLVTEGSEEQQGGLLDRLDDERETFQLRLWSRIAGIGLVGAYAIAFIVLNTRHVKVSFVLTSTRVSVIWVILLSLAIGVVLGVLASQLHRRRSRAR